jgi:hypothetical protein
VQPRPIQQAAPFPVSPNQRFGPPGFSTMNGTR